MDRVWTLYLVFPKKIKEGEVNNKSRGGGGVLPYITYTGMCRQRGRDFEALDVEWGIHFRGVF